MPSLQQQLLQDIQRGGPIAFSSFMETALYDPLHGYYASGRARIGKAGDFITAVSTGRLFGRLLARQFHEMWTLLHCPPNWTLVEQGAFNGQLCHDILSFLEDNAPECFAATDVQIIEPFSTLQSLQALRLKKFDAKTTWHRTCETLPNFTGVHYSNELLDAFPVHLLRREDSGWQELRVSHDENGFILNPFPIENALLLEATKTLPDRETGFTTEVNLQCAPWLEQIRHKLTEGWLLTFDYGMQQAELLAPHRKNGTLSAYRAHQRSASPLAHPGEQDLSAHVNFTAVAGHAIRTGWRITGYTDQHRFFTGLAPLHFKDGTRKLTPAEQKEILEFRTLTHPELLGLQFKALCLSTSPLPSLSGFQHAAAGLSLLEQ
jgi:SAM-dependent MidA family methyltransferase